MFRRGCGDIAHYAGVGVGTVYRHFPDREQLIDGLFEQRIDEIAVLMQAGLEDPDPWRGLTGFLERNLELQAKDRGLRELILGAAGGFDRLSRARARLYPVGAQLLARAQEAGVLRADVEPQDLPLLQLMLSGVIDVSHDVAPDLWRRYLAIVLRGLRADPRAPDPLPAEPPPFEQVDQMLAAGFGPKR
jgi:AcrR family transcriptional regulator